MTRSVLLTDQGMSGLLDAISDFYDKINPNIELLMDWDSIYQGWKDDITFYSQLNLIDNDNVESFIPITQAWVFVPAFESGERDARE